MSLWPQVRDHIAARVLRLRGRSSPPVGGRSVDPPGDFADPYVLRVGSVYFAYATNSGPTNVQVMTSSDLDRWQPMDDALPQLPAWAAPGWTWAPVVSSRAGRYVLYYTVCEPGSGRQAISVASADRPEGPFVDASDGPLVFQLDRGGSIDPSPFLDVDGTPYLLWKSDDNAFDRPSSLWGRRLTADGLAFAGPPAELLRHDKGWERPLVEAPSMVHADGRYYLFYSANWWESSNYAVGYAIGPSPLGPFTKVTRGGPWFGPSGDVAGPGGQEFFTDTTGALCMAYHAWSPGKVGYGAGGARSLRIGRLEFPHGAPTTRSRGPVPPD